MLKKIALTVFFLGLLLILLSTYVNKQMSLISNSAPTLNPIGVNPSGNKDQVKSLKDKSIFKDRDNLNILLIGSDTSSGRRLRGQRGFNTDVMVLLSVNPVTNKVLLTSVPRDLWVNNNKINALYIVYGWETLKNAFEKITGQMVDGYVMADFDAFVWLINSCGGVPVEVKNSFTDYEFPNSQDSGQIMVNFTSGSEMMSGERALTYARSRKGNNGEGSDLMRARRQHLILQGLVDAISQPESIFWPMDIPVFYEMITQHMETNLSIDDFYYLWDFYKDNDKYAIESFVVDGEYVYHPGMYPQSSYHAWVFVPIGDSYEKLHNDIYNKLQGTFTEEEPIENKEITISDEIKN